MRGLYKIERNEDYIVFLFPPVRLGEQVYHKALKQPLVHWIGEWSRVQQSKHPTFFNYAKNRTRGFQFKRLSLKPLALSIYNYSSSTRFVLDFFTETMHVNPCVIS